MYKISATVFALASVLVCTNAFFSSDPYPQYGSRMQNRRRYRQPHQQYYRNSRRHRQYRQQPEQKRRKEIIKDLQRKIELYVPCSPYCTYYEARVKPSRSFGHSRNLQTIQVSGPGYEKSWDIPENVNINEITKSVVQSQYFKLDFPKLMLSENDNFERDFQNYKNYHSMDEEAKQNRQTQHRQQQNRQNRHSNYHADYYYAEKNNEYNRLSKYDNSDNYNENGTKEQQQTQANPNIDPYFYATSDGIEIVDVDTNDMEYEFHEKDSKKVSIGFWDSRGKFQYY